MIVKTRKSRLKRNDTVNTHPGASWFALMFECLYREKRLMKLSLKPVSKQLSCERQFPLLTISGIPPVCEMGLSTKQLCHWSLGFGGKPRSKGDSH